MGLYSNYITESTLPINEAAKYFEDEPRDIIAYLKKVYKSEDSFDKISEESINSAINKKYHRGINKEWASYMEEWCDGKDEKYDSILKSKAKFCRELDCVEIWNDGGGSELGYDLNSDRIYMFDHDFGFLSKSLSKKQILSLSSK